MCDKNSKASSNEDTYFLLKLADGALLNVDVAQHPHDNLTLLFITPIKQGVQEASSPLKEDTRTALESLDENYWEWDIGSDLVYFSPELIAMLGYKKQSLSAPSSFWKKTC